METIIIKRKNGKKETHFRAKCSICGKDRGFVRKNRVKQSCQECGGRKAGLQNKGKIGPNKGKTFSAESRQKMSAAKKGIEPWNKGQKESRKEVIAKIARAKVGKLPSNKNKPMAEDQKIKLSCSARGLHLDEFDGFSTELNKRERNKFAEMGLHKKCFERDNWTCSRCLQYGGELHAHHLNAWHAYPEQRFLLENLVTLCVNCHKTFHSRQKMVTQESWKSFLKEETSKDIYLITGAPGAGKSWILRQLTNLTTIDSDQVKRSDIRRRLLDSTRPIFSLTVGVDTYIKVNRDLSIKLVVIQEPLDTIKLRILSRGGALTSTLERRVNRMKVLAQKALFTGSSDEVLNYLQNLK